MIYMMLYYLVETLQNWSFMIEITTLERAVNQVLTSEDVDQVYHVEKHWEKDKEPGGLLTKRQVGSKLKALEMCHP